MNFQQGVAYKIDPEIEDCEDRYYLSRFNKGQQQGEGLYFHRMVHDGEEAMGLSYFTPVELEEGVLVEAE